MIRAVLFYEAEGAEKLEAVPAFFLRESGSETDME